MRSLEANGVILQQMVRQGTNGTIPSLGTDLDRDRGLSHMFPIPRDQSRGTLGLEGHVIEHVSSHSHVTTLAVCRIM